MVRSIVVPLDGSPFSLHALPAALGLAGRAKASIHLVHVQPLGPLVGIPGTLAVDPVIDADCTADMERYLETVATWIRRGRKLEVSVTVRHGHIAEAIAEQAREADAGLIVLTTHGRGGLSRLWLGSVADELVRTADVPVLAVRPTRRAPDLGRARRLHHVLVPLDGSEVAEHALGPAVDVARGERARITLLRVVTPRLGIARPAPVTRLDWADLARQNRAALIYLRSVAARFSRDGLRVAARVIADANPARAILRAAAAGRADLIAMATHTRTVPARFLRGSVCDKVLRGASGVALLLTRPHAAEATSRARAAHS